MTNYLNSINYNSIIIIFYKKNNFFYPLFKKKNKWKKVQRK